MTGPPDCWDCGHPHKEHNGPDSQCHHEIPVGLGAKLCSCHMYLRDALGSELA